MTEAKQLDEVALRRPDFAADVPVVLDDGQTWHLPRPRIRFQAAMRDGVIVAQPKHSFGTEYLEKVEAYQRAANDETEGGMDRFMVAAFDIATALLMRNYDLTFDEASSLFTFDFSPDPEPASLERFTAFVNTGLGNDVKKPSPDGSEPT